MSVERYFQIDAPTYSCDHIRARMNPVWLIGHEYSLPSVRCSQCGIVADFTYLAGDAPHKRLLEFPELTEQTFLPTKIWKKRAELWAKALAMPTECLRPAMKIGRPKLELRGRSFNDFTFPYSNRVFVTDTVKELIEASKFSGVSFLESIPIVKKTKLRGFIPPRLWHLQVSSDLETNVTSDPRRTICPECGRATSDFPIPTRIRFLKHSWDGNDFFGQGKHAFRISITERVKTYIEAKGFTNIAFEQWADPIE